MIILYIILSILFMLDEHFITKTHTTPLFSILIPYIYHIQCIPLIGTIKSSEVRANSTSSSSEKRRNNGKGDCRLRDSRGRKPGSGREPGTAAERTRPKSNMATNFLLHSISGSSCFIIMLFTIMFPPLHIYNIRLLDAIYKGHACV